MGERQFAQCARAWPLWDKMVDGDGCDQVKSPFSCDVDHNLYGHFMARRRGRKEGGPFLQGATVDLQVLSSAEWRHWIGLVVSISAFGSEGRRFESTKGYTPDRDMCASLLVRVAPHCKPSPG